MTDTIRALVAIADEIDPTLVESAISDPSLTVVGVSKTLNEDWQAFLREQSDVVIVACSEYNEKAMHVVDRAVKQRPDRPVVVLAQMSPNGVLRQAFEAGADDVIALPQTPE